MRQHGFTLIELLVTIAVMAIMATIAVPGFQSMIASNRLASDYNEILSGLNYARSEAIKRREDVTFKAESTAPWSYEVTASNMLRSRTGSSGSVEVSGDLEISFNSKGRVESPACTGGCSIMIGHTSAGDRTINISSFGRVGRG
ncbi:GspH/FimT family pseudopilin [Halomonas sp. BC04]|uniref:GspH/FimT family pseudopilin n=1 Tax=Halomonas sp. BC04 TaxID=1403540 RepID=UPI0003ED6ED5|nr:GspH/FimT family pseudopilin [Halomonas sp. BC04]EWH00614.1 hypothetical protein Q427_18520 [Halomonas sp. BC04]